LKHTASPVCFAHKVKAKFLTVKRKALENFWQPELLNKSIVQQEICQIKKNEFEFCCA